MESQPEQPLRIKERAVLSISDHRIGGWPILMSNETTPQMQVSIWKEVHGDDGEDSHKIQLTVGTTFRAGGQSFRVLDIVEGADGRDGYATIVHGNAGQEEKS